MLVKSANSEPYWPVREWPTMQFGKCSASMVDRNCTEGTKGYRANRTDSRTNKCGLLILGAPPSLFRGLIRGECQCVEYGGTEYSKRSRDR